MGICTSNYLTPEQAARQKAEKDRNEVTLSSLSIYSLKTLIHFYSLLVKIIPRFRNNIYLLFFCFISYIYFLKFIRSVFLISLYLGFAKSSRQYQTK